MLPSVCAANIARLRREPRVDCGPEIMDLDLAGGAVDRYLGDPCCQGVVLDHGADAETAVSGALARPVGHLGDRAQERLHARRALGEREAERDRIEAAVLGDFVQKAFHREGVVARCRRRGRRRAGRRGARSRARRACAGSGIAGSASPSSPRGRAAPAACRWRSPCRPRPTPPPRGDARR